MSKTYHNPGLTDEDEPGGGFRDFPLLWPGIYSIEIKKCDLEEDSQADISKDKIRGYGVICDPPANAPHLVGERIFFRFSFGDPRGKEGRPNYPNILWWNFIRSLKGLDKSSELPDGDLKVNPERWLGNKLNIEVRYDQKQIDAGWSPRRVGPCGVYNPNISIVRQPEQWIIDWDREDQAQRRKDWQEKQDGGEPEQTKTEFPDVSNIITLDDEDEI